MAPITEADNRPQLHVSAMEMLSRCAEQWRRRYLCNEKIPPGAALIVGKASHYSIELNLKNKLEEGEPLEREQAIAIAADTVKNDFELEVRLAEGETRKGARDQTVDLAVGLSGLHYDEVCPNVYPKSVEEPFLVTMDGYPFDYAGTFDTEESGRVLRDVKTSSPQQKWKQEKADNHVQFSGYAFAYQIVKGSLPHSIVVDNLVKKKVPEYVRVVTKRDDDDLQAFIRRYEACCKVIESETFLPCSPGDWVCSPKWCGYHGGNGGGCPYTKGKARPKT